MLHTDFGIVYLGFSTDTQHNAYVLKPGETDAPAGLKRYETKYYVIYTDLPDDDAKETGLRMTRMAEEYYARTKEFSGKINKKDITVIASMVIAAGGPSPYRAARIG